MSRRAFTLFTFLATATAQAAPERERLIHPLGDAFLLLPDRCEPSCPLVIVSASRGLGATASLERPHLQRMYEGFRKAGHAVLLSNDGEMRAWGHPTTLMYLSQIRERAVRRFAFNGNTYMFGFSMGGLSALLSAYKKVFPVSGVLLLDARVNLLDAWYGSDLGRRAEIAAAMGVSVTHPLPFGADPLHDYDAPEVRELPVFVAGSPDDQTVSFAVNGEALFHENTSRESQLFLLKGPHLGASHFGGEVLGAMVSFVNRLEHLQRFTARGPGLQQPAVQRASGSDR